MANNLGKYLVPAKAVSSKPFSIPKEPQGRPNSGSGQGRQSASAYGKVAKQASGSMAIPMEVQNHPALK